MQKITRESLRDLPRSKVAEAVWAAVLGIAATHNAHADDNIISSDDNEHLKELDEQIALKDKSAMAAMGGAAAGADKDIIGDGSAIEHAGQENGSPAPDTQASNKAPQQQNQQASNNQQTTTEQTIAANSSAEIDVATANVGEAGEASDVSDDSVAKLSSEAEDSSEGALSSFMSSAGQIVAGMEFDTGLLALLGVGAAAGVAIAVNNDDDDDNDSSGNQGTVSGTAIDGYVAGATVWADSNGDGVQDEGETTVTDNSGNFTLDGVPEGTTVSILPGGRDVLTGEIVETTMTSSASAGGTIVVSPLTTLLANGADEAELKEALGLSNDVDLSTFDPIEAITSDDPAQQQLGESIFTAAQQVMTSLQAGVANGGSVADVAASLATSVNNAAEGSDFSNAVTETLGEDLGNVVNNVNSAIESSLSSGNLATAINSGSFEQLADTMDVTAIAQTQLVNAIEQANESGTVVDAADWTAEAIETSADEWMPELNESNLEFLIEEGLSLEGANIEITDAEFLQSILDSETSGMLSGADVEVDDSLAEFTDELAATTGTDVVVTDLGDY